MQEDVKAIKIISQWASLQGHDRCWYYPEFIQPLAEIYKLSLEGVVLIPQTREMFDEGCRQFRSEQYNHSQSKSFISTNSPRDCLAAWIEEQKGKSYTYHDQILQRLATLFGITLPSRPNVPEKELEEGCLRFQLTQYLR